MKFTVLAFLLLVVTSVSASSPSPYAGEEINEIKSLSPAEISGLIAGQGLGFAKAAELNQYPGPKHVLELAGDLQLSAQQISETNRIFESMRAQAITLGTQLVAHEKELDLLFVSGQVTAETLDLLLLKIGEVEARLRGAHLHAHLEMKALLSMHQIKTYDDLRGYSSGNATHNHSN